MRAAHAAILVATVGLLEGLTCETRAQSLTVIGNGTRECGEYLLAVENERKSKPANPDPEGFYTVPYLLFVEWLDGFLSGYNDGDFIDRYVGRGVSRAAKMAFVENWCRSNPLAGFLGAAHALRSELKKRGE